MCLLDDVAVRGSAMNGSGYGDGRYASPPQVRQYLDRMTAYLERRNAEWLDRWQDRRTGEFPPGIRELCNAYRADNHLVKWCKRHGLIDRRSCGEDGIKHGQIGKLTSVVYHRDKKHRQALTWELAAYLDAAERAQIVDMESRRDPLDEFLGRVQAERIGEA